MKHWRSRAILLELLLSRRCSKRKKQSLDQMQSFSFFILIDEVSNSDNFVLTNTSINRSSLIIIKLTIKLVVHILFKEILGDIIEFKY